MKSGKTGQTGVGERQAAEYDKKTIGYIEKAAHLFASKGYRQCGVQEVADHLGLSKGGFYWYFDSKEDLYSRICGLHCGRAQRLFRETLGAKPLDAQSILEVSLQIIDSLLQDLDHLNLMFGFYAEVEHPAIRGELKRLDQEWERTMVALIELCIKQGIVQSDIDPTTQARMATAFLGGLMSRFRVHGDKEEILLLWKQFFRLFFNVDARDRATG